MKRSGPIQRTTRLSRGTRLRPRNPARRAKEWARAYHSPERVQFVNSLRCVVGRSCGGAMENAHIKGGGMARKGAYELTVPMCHHHHIDVLHAVGSATFARAYDLDLPALAAATERAWLAFTRNA